VADENGIPATEPVITVTTNGHSKIYPLRILTWHEIVNDSVGGVPVAVTYRKAGGNSFPATPSLVN